MALPFLILSHATRQPALAHGPSGYRPGGAHRLASTGLAIAITGGVGATLILALVVPDMIKDPPTILIGKPVEAEPPKVIETTEPAAKPVDQRTALVRPLVKLPPVAIDPFEFDTGPIDPGPIEVRTGIGLGGGGGVIDPPGLVIDPVFRKAERDPRFADRFQPVYPPAMEREQIEGRCPVTVTIAASGRVTAIEDNGCSSDAFFRTTERQALRHWRFRPATRDGVPVESREDVAVAFRLEE
jgi:periplasmic protein TonB